MKIEWTYETPKEPGWYWVTYHGYELAEVVCVTKDFRIYSAGAKGSTPYSQINKWAKSPLEIPEQ